VTALAEERAAQGSGGATVDVEETPGDRTGRPGGRRFGSLVHALLATLDLDASPDTIVAAAALQGRLVEASDEEVGAAAVAVGDALAHPVLRRAAEASALRRETPVLARIPDGRLAEGVIDLAFRDAAGDWTVVDFKTDRELGERREVYAEQVRIYAEAVGRATGESARGLLLIV
jgi:ATP-dependent exoDNAse (exonuclease V) beta subunit